MPRVAITYDWLTSFGGAERVLQQLHHVFPTAPIYTSVCDPERLADDMRSWDIRPSVLQHVPFSRRYSRAMLPAMPFAFDQFDFSGYDAVLSVSSAFSKHVMTAWPTVHLCYCLTPPRYLWMPEEGDERLKGLGAVARPLIALLKAADLRAAGRVDRFVGISQTVSDRIRDIYGRQAPVIFPPVDTQTITPSGLPAEDFYLVVSRLVPQKRIDLAVEACTQLGRPLIVVGDGSERRRLERMAGPTVRFVGTLPDEQVFDLYARCRAFLFPGLEDFGITPVEAQAAGRPVVAFGKGGASETVVDHQTGLLFYDQSSQALTAAILELDALRIQPEDCRTNALRFSNRRFRDEIERAVLQAVGIS